jgi:uncharacterized protein YjbJ (UPF0337 family)
MKTQNREWKETRSKIKAQFGKLSSSDIDELNGHMEKLTNKIQKTYGYARPKAERECKNFTESLRSH